MKIQRIFTLALVCSFFGQAFAASIDDLAQSNQWRALLHYQKFLGLDRSLNENPRFFLAKNGKRNPSDELLANINALKKNHEYRCHFPARTEFLVSKLKLTRRYLNRRHCTGLSGFHDQLKLRSVSLVFADYYINETETLFGHTFLRLSRSGRLKDRIELDDFGVSLGTTQDSYNQFTHAFSALFGMHKGEYHVLPYRQTIRDLNHAEYRDHWVYHLDLSSREMKMLINHLWELKRAHFDYHYLDENSSYHLLTLLRVIKPDLNLTNSIGLFTTVPSETIKAVARSKGLVSSISFKPSPFTKFRQRFYQLDGDQRSALKSYLDEYDFTNLQGFSSYQQAQVMDTALAYYDFTNTQGLLKQSLKTMAGKQTLVNDRSRTPVINTDIKFEKEKTQAPHFIHRPSKLALGVGNVESTTFVDFDVSMGFHDYLDHAHGYLDRASVRLPGFKLRLIDEQWFVNEMHFFETENYHDYREVHSLFSYKINFASKRAVSYKECANCMGTHLGGSLGLSLIQDTYFAYLGLHQEFLFNSSLNEDLDYGIGVDITAGVNLLEDLKFKLNYQHLRYTFNGFTLPKIILEAQKNFTSNYAAKLAVELVDDTTEFALSGSLRF